VNSPMRRVESPPMMHPWLHAQMRSALTTRTAAFWMPPSYPNGQPRSACRPSNGHPRACGPAERSYRPIETQIPVACRPG